MGHAWLFPRQSMHQNEERGSPPSLPLHYLDIVLWALPAPTRSQGMCPARAVVDRRRRGDDDDTH